MIFVFICVVLCAMSGGRLKKVPSGWGQNFPVALFLGHVGIQYTGTDFIDSGKG